MFEIIPAIDIIAGRCVRLTQGRYDQETIYDENPLEVAKRWHAEGARRLHVVDLEGARAGVPVNLDVISRICKGVPIPIQMGGGIRSIEIAYKVLNAGVERVIIGTSAAVDSEVAARFFRELRDRVVLSVDSRKGRLAIRGWEAETEESAVEFAKRMQVLGARRIIFTDISRDGVLSGIDLSGVREFVKAVDIPVIIAGGITYVEDIRRLMTLENRGIEGAIIGKALYAGTITLADALAAAARGDT